jgi:hypothetical protein
MGWCQENRQALAKEGDSTCRAMLGASSSWLINPLSHHLTPGVFRWPVSENVSMQSVTRQQTPAERVLPAATGSVNHGNRLRQSCGAHL